MGLRLGVCVSLLALLSAGCGGAPGGTDRNVECAALISASTYLHVRGEIDLGAEAYQKSLFSLMVYTNSYAIPNNIPEKQAFDEIKTRREALMADMAPERVKRGALSCLRRTPKV